MAALSQTPANVVVNSSPAPKLTNDRTAGATVAAGMPVYKDTTDNNQHKPGRANAEVTAIVEGIALVGAADEQPLVIARTGTKINLGATLTQGETYCLSPDVAGEIVPIGDLGSGDVVVILGVAEDTAMLLLNIINSGITRP